MKTVAVYRMGKRDATDGKINEWIKRQTGNWLQAKPVTSGTTTHNRKESRGKVR